MLSITQRAPRYLNDMTMRIALSYGRGNVTEQEYKEFIGIIERIKSLLVEIKIREEGKFDKI